MRQCATLPESALLLAGTALALAVFLPNIEFIFGLAGSTASVLIAYILPAAIFLSASRPPKHPTGTLISIQSPTLITAHSGQNPFSSGDLPNSPKESIGHAMSPRVLASPRRKAWALLVFGMVVAVVCTRATLTAVQQEAEVVQLAQELAASEAAVSTASHTSYLHCHKSLCLQLHAAWYATDIAKVPGMSLLQPNDVSHAQGAYR